MLCIDDAYIMRSFGYNGFGISMNNFVGLSSVIGILDGILGVMHTQMFSEKLDHFQL